MVVLGIDPGSRKAGHGVIQVLPRTLGYVASGVLDYVEAGDFIERMGPVYRSCRRLVERFNPDAIAIESLIHVKNVSSLAKLAQTRGAMLAAFGQTHKGRIFEYGPTVVKRSVTGYGQADKQSVERAIKTLLNEPLTFCRHDQSDALAIAICHALALPAKKWKAAEAK